MQYLQHQLFDAKFLFSCVYLTTSQCMDFSFPYVDGKISKTENHNLF